MAEKHLALLVHREHTALSTFRRLLQSNGTYQCGGWIAEQGVLKLLLGLKGRVGLGGIRGEPIDGKSGGGQGFVVIAEEANLVGTLCHGERQPLLAHNDATRRDAHPCTYIPGSKREDR